MLAAYSSGETALVFVSTATSTSARPVGSRNSTTLVPNSDCGCGAVVQSRGACRAKRPCGSLQVTRLPAAGAATGDTAGFGFAAAAGVARTTAGSLLVGRG